jgi:hypothetical protein
MKTKEAMEIMDEGWVKRLKGFRVHFQQRVDGEWTTDYFPDMEEKPLPSDISAWELARRFAEATKPEKTEGDDEGVVNIYVVDESENPIKHYGTGQLEVFNRSKPKQVS